MFKCIKNKVDCPPVIYETSKRTLKKHLCTALSDSRGQCVNCGTASLVTFQGGVVSRLGIGLAGLILVCESGEEVVCQTQFGHTSVGPRTGHRKILNPIMGQIQGRKAGEFCDIARDLCELIVGEIEPLQTVHPVCARADGKLLKVVV